MDNHWIVPFNPFLSMKYKAHINVEVCSTITALKYLYKYVYKGPDRATISMRVQRPLQPGAVPQPVNEIDNFVDAK